MWSNMINECKKIGGYFEISNEAESGAELFEFFVQNKINKMKIDSDV